MPQRHSFTRQSDGPGHVIYASLVNELQAAIEPLQVVTAVTTTYTALSTDDVILADATGGAFDVDLPTAVGIPGKRYTVKRTSASNNVTLDPNGSETIDGAASKALASQHAFLTIVSDGANWQIISSGGTIS